MKSYRNGDIESIFARKGNTKYKKNKTTLESLDLSCQCVANLIDYCKIFHTQFWIKASTKALFALNLF